MDFLKSAVASAIAKSSSLPYSLGDRVDVSDSIWLLYNATKRDDGSSCSIFVFDIAPNKSRLPLAKNALRKSRTLRHPGVLKVLDTIETEANLYIVTERVVPLAWHVKRRSINEETAKWGLYTVASTLKFINEEASSIHGAIRASSVFISDSGEWKLGGFDILSSMNDDDPIIYAYGSLAPDSARYNPPEVAKDGWGIIKRHPLTAIDAYGLGILVFEVFNGYFTGGDQVGKTTNIPASMHQSYKRLCTANPKLRLSPAHFVEHGKRNGSFFKGPLIRLADDIEKLGLKSDAEREEFINDLDEFSGTFPGEFFKMKVLPELLKSVEFGGGGPKVLEAILKIGAKLTQDEYTSMLTPVIVRLFGNPDRALRVCLLDNLSLMVDSLPQKIVNDKIFPQMTSGFTDIAPVVREQTVKAVLLVIGKLSDRTINGELLKFLARTANDEQPGIRTNTTICLGKIAKNLGQGSRAKVLIAAFSRSIRDPFVHARNAGLLSFSATIEYFTEEDCATKVLPVICPALLDKEKMIRDQANKTIDLYLQRVRKYGNTMPDTMLLATDTTGTTKEPTRIGTSKDKSWAGWAISSFTNKITPAAGEIQATTSGGKLAEMNVDRSSPLRRPTKSSPSVQEPHPKEILRAESQSPERPAAVISEEKAEADDAIDAWDAFDDYEQPKDEPFDSISTKSSSTRPILKPSPAPFDDGGEPDFAGWLAAQSMAKTKKALPKGLNKPMRPMKPNASTTKAKKIDTRPQEEIGDDWGAAW